MTLAPWAHVFLAGAAAQLLKSILYGLVNRRLHLRTVVAANGLPSLHGVVLACLATIIWLEHGVEDSAYNAMLLYGGIILHDAMKVKGRVERGSRTALLLAESMHRDGRAGGAWRSHLAPMLSERAQRPWHVLIGVLLGVLAGLLYTPQI